MLLTPVGCRTKHSITALYIGSEIYYRKMMQALMRGERSGNYCIYVIEGSEYMGSQWALFMPRLDEESIIEVGTER